MHLVAEDLPIHGGADLDRQIATIAVAHAQLPFCVATPAPEGALVQGAGSVLARDDSVCGTLRKPLHSRVPVPAAGVADAELAIGVSSPAVEGALASSAGVCLADGDLVPDPIVQPHGGEGVLAYVADPEYPLVLASPAVERSVERSVRGESAGIRLVGVDAPPLAGFADLRGLRRLAFLARVPTADLTVSVASPAVATPLGVHPAGGVLASIQIDSVTVEGQTRGPLEADSHPRAEFALFAASPAVEALRAASAGMRAAESDLDPARIQTDLSRPCFDIPATGAELTLLVVAPAMQRAVFANAAAVGEAHVHILPDAFDPLRGEDPIVAIAGTDLAAIREAPAEKAPVGLQGAGVVLVGGDARPVAFVVYLSRKLAIVPLTDAQLAATVLTEAMQRVSLLEAADVASTDRDIHPGRGSDPLGGKSAAAPPHSVFVCAPAIEAPVFVHRAVRSSPASSAIQGPPGTSAGR